MIIQDPKVIYKTLWGDLFMSMTNYASIVTISLSVTYVHFPFILARMVMLYLPLTFPLNTAFVSVVVFTFARVPSLRTRYTL